MSFSMPLCQMPLVGLCSTCCVHDVAVTSLYMSLLRIQVRANVRAAMRLTFLQRIVHRLDYELANHWVQPLNQVLYAADSNQFVPLLYAGDIQILTRCRLEGAVRCRTIRVMDVTDWMPIIISNLTCLYICLSRQRHYVPFGVFVKLFQNLFIHAPNNACVFVDVAVPVHEHIIARNSVLYGR